MTFVLDLEQRQFQDTARRFFSECSPTSSFRQLRDGRDALGYRREVWDQIVGMGFPAITVPDKHGGLGLGYLTLGCTLEEAGRTLSASPLLATTVLGATAVELCGSASQGAEWLGAVVQGLTLTLALDEGHHHDPRAMMTTAVRRGDRYLLNGAKTFVIDGHSADKLIVVAVESDSSSRPSSIQYFVVDRDTPGITVDRIHAVDSRNAANIKFDNVEVDNLARLGGSLDGQKALERVCDVARACIAAEMIGGVAELFDRTMAYLRDREQFGVKIGSFQALKHRAAKMYVEIELTRSAVIAALSALDSSSNEASLLACLAKARANDTYQLVSNEAIQMHGGIGVTDELDVGLFLKRSRVLSYYFGNSRYLRNRYAELSGY